MVRETPFTRQGDRQLAREPTGTAAIGSANQITGLIHLYRAEIGRLTAFRTRLDTTTAWTVTTVTIITTFGLTNHDVPHAAFLFVMGVLFFFLHLEARRFRAYETSRYKVLLLERYFYPALLGYEADPQWLDQLVEALRNPQLKLNYLGALGWRLRRTYIWLYIAVLGIWIAKLYVKGAPSYAAGPLTERARIGDVPGAVVVGLVVAWYVGLIAVTLGARRIYPLGDDEARFVLHAAVDD